MSAITYQVGDSLYLNVTNRCTNQCPFCIRYKSREFDQKYRLWLDKEPSAAELLAEIGDASKYRQVVFCGYGEPTIRLDVLKDVADKLKARFKSFVRLDTNGHGNLFWGRNILPELKGLVDYVSVSLNAPDAATYDKLCRSVYGPAAFPAVLAFLKEAKQYIPEVEASVVDLPSVDQKKSRELATALGVKFRVRPYYEESYVR